MQPNSERRQKCTRGIAEGVGFKNQKKGRRVEKGSIQVERAS